MSAYSKRKDATVNGPARPLMPRLAVSAQASRSSPAPKLAGYNSPSPQLKRSQAQTTPQPPTSKSLQEEKSTPVTNFISVNVTPRSSSRKSRADSSQSTPTTEIDTTPSRLRPASTLGLDHVDSKSQASYAERSGSDVDRIKTQHGGPQNKHKSLPASPNITQSPERMEDSFAPAENSARFFRADERPSKDPMPIKSQHKKTGSFVYANGAADSSGRDPPGASERDSYFPHANQVAFRNNASGHPVSQHATTFAPPNSGGQPSPTKSGFHLTYRKGASQVMPPQPFSPPLLDRSSSDRRKSSIDDEDSRRQSRTFSVSSFGSGVGDQVARKEQPFPFLSMFPVPSSKNSPMASPIGAEPDQLSMKRDSVHLLSGNGESIRSSASAVGSSDGDPQRSEAAAHARRERKIMDLEISNSSLLVINRSLEKEMRKQKLELRRYKRLSRKSNLLLDDASLISSGRPSDIIGDDDDEEDASLEDPEEDEASEDSFAEEPTSPGAFAQRDARHKKGDQLRLRKDLEKHKELLADSQKMNQSLKKCLSVTEQLILEGNKALEYKVHHEDVPLGGRVLSPEEQTGEFSSSRAPTPFDDGDVELDQASTAQTTPPKTLVSQIESDLDELLMDSNNSHYGLLNSIDKQARRTTVEVLGETF